MSSTNFKVTKHVFPGQHIRQYPRALRNREEDIQYLQVNQYTPLNNLNPQDGDVTILATGGTGFPKEMYEPLWEELLTHCHEQGVRIRGIWCLDKSDHGESGVLNEMTQGDDPSYLDLARDVLQMVNVFRDQMTLPVVGIGHSMGATALIEVARLHPRLFSSLILTDPIVGPEVQKIETGVFFLNYATRRPDLWDSREEAESFFKDSKGLKSWDRRVVDKFVKHGLRDTPTLLYPQPGKVTLKTSRAHESWNYGRAYFDPVPEGESHVSESSRIKYPDAGEYIRRIAPFYRPESTHVWNDMTRMQCSVLYLFPGNTTPDHVKATGQTVEQTGSGWDGTGGVKTGRTAQVMIKGAGHLAPFEKPGDCARETAAWLAKDLEGWRARRKFERENRDDKSIDQTDLSEEWKRQTKVWMDKYKAGLKQKPKL